MKHTLRRLLFWFFIVLFFVIASSILLYAFGYRFNFTRNIFVYTGSVTIKSNPQTVDIRVDGQTIPPAHLGLLNNSIHIPGLTPGEHFVEVSAPGYRPWSKKAVVQSGLSTEFWNVLLTQEKPPLHTLSDTLYTKRMFPSPNENLIAIAKQQGKELTVDTFDVASEQVVQVFSALDTVFPQTKDENIEWSADNQRLLIPLFRNDTLDYAVVDLESGNAVFLNNIIRTKGPLRSPHFDPTTKGSLLFIAGTALFRTNIETDSIAPQPLRDDVRAYSLSSQNVYYLNAESGVINRIAIDKGDQVPDQITLSPMVTNQQNHIFSLVVYDNDHLALLDRSSGLLRVFDRNMTDDPIKDIATDIRGLQFSNDGKKLLFYTENQVAVYFTQDWEVQPTRSAASIIQIALFSSPIDNIQWTEDYEHILFSLNDTAKIIELDNRDKRNISDLVSLPTGIRQIISFFGINRLFFVPTDTTSLPITTLSFPSPAGFLGLQ